MLNFAHRLCSIGNLRFVIRNNSDHWLAEVEKWSRLAQTAISTDYEECNAIQFSDVARATSSGGGDH